MRNMGQDKNGKMNEMNEKWQRIRVKLWEKKLKAI